MEGLRFDSGIRAVRCEVRFLLTMVANRGIPRLKVRILPHPRTDIRSGTPEIVSGH